MIRVNIKSREVDLFWFFVIYYDYKRNRFRTKRLLLNKDEEFIVSGIYQCSNDAGKADEIIAELENTFVLGTIMTILLSDMLVGSIFKMFGLYNY
ncbi:MAG: hypothetical protein IJC76_05175 [Lachnospiraceae bacterium]|nr:hypothetical protein [Lachnospiraceae bacterium]